MQHLLHVTLQGFLLELFRHQPHLGDEHVVDVLRLPASSLGYGCSWCLCRHAGETSLLRGGPASLGGPTALGFALPALGSAASLLGDATRLLAHLAAFALALAGLPALGSASSLAALSFLGSASL